jgi:osmotically-inducible protein OsmY
LSKSPGRQQAAASSCRIGLLPAAALGVVALAGWPAALAQAPAAQPVDQATHPQVVVTATRLSDALLTAKVEEALADDRWVYTGHLSVVTENGVVRLEGLARDPSELNRALMLARRVAGKRRVLDEVILMEVDEDNDF